MSPCFLCDTKLYGERTRVCSSITPHSNVPYPEKIVEILGDDFLIIVTPADHMCKKCTSLLTHLDKLENDLKLVKNAILSYIQKKYGLLPADQALKDIEIVNGHLKADEQPEQEQRKVATGLAVREATTVTTAAIVTPIQTPLKLLKTTQQQPQMQKQMQQKQQLQQQQPKQQTQQQTQQDAGNKMKIYKCGFCTFQSKELGHVRFHMRTHTNRKEPEKPIVNQPAPKPPTTVSQKRRLYRCQVCSKSFDSRINCLDHIQKDHNQPTASTSASTSNGEKETEDSHPVTTTANKPEPSKSQETDQEDEASMDVDDNQEDDNKGTIDTDMMLNDNVTPTESAADLDPEPEEETKNTSEEVETENSQEDNDAKSVQPESELEEANEEEGEDEKVAAGLTQEDDDQETPDSVNIDVDQETTIIENKPGDLDIESMLAAIHNDNDPTSSGDTHN